MKPSTGVPLMMKKEGLQDSVIPKYGRGRVVGVCLGEPQAPGKLCQVLGDEEES